MRPRIPLPPPLAAGLAACALVACGGDGGAASDRPHVVMIIVDTLRADRLGCYGYELDTSPVVDDLAAGATLFESNSSQCNSTFPSITSIMTGLYPRTHRNYIPVPLEGVSGTTSEHASLAERLRDAGYRTFAAVSHPGWAELPRDVAMARGWERFSVISGEVDRNARVTMDHAELTNARVFEMLDEYERDGGPDAAPLFLWVHYFDPHTPYAPPEGERRFLAHHLEAIGAGAHLAALEDVDLTDRAAVRRAAPPGVSPHAFVEAVRRALYDAEIRYCDAQIGRLFDRLDAMGVLDDAIVAFLADHGENMGETERPGLPHLAFNHERLFDAVVRVPLILRRPGQADGRTVGGITQSIDVMPTVLDLLDLEPDPRIEGKSLVPLLIDNDGAIHETVFIESSDHVEKAVRTDDLKYIDPGEDDEPFLFRWREDPAEREDLAAAAPADVLERLDGHIEEFKPLDCLRVRLAPDAEPYRARLRILADAPVIEDVLPVEGGALADSLDGYAWSGTVADDPVDLALFLEEKGALLRVLVDREDAEEEWRRVLLGRTPIERTTAIPIYAEADAPPPESPRLAVEVGDGGYALALELGADERAVLEVRHSSGYGNLPELVAAEGFEPLEVLVGSFGDSGGRSMFSEATGPGRARARIRFPEGESQPLFNVRLDGAVWPDPSRVALNGRAARVDRLDFALAYRGDGRLTAVLLAGSAAAELPRGAVAFWLEGGGGAVDIDTAGMSPEEVERLRALGYVSER